jgi:hypothetical protein
MTCLAAQSQPCVSRSDRWTMLRDAVFWGFILLVIVSPAALSAMILMHA